MRRCHGFISETSSVTMYHYFLILYRFCLLEWITCENFKKSVRPNLWNEKVPCNKILSDRLFYFSQLHQVRLPRSTPYRGRFENNNVFLLKNCAANVFSFLQDEMTCANIWLLAQFPLVEKIYPLNTRAFLQVPQITREHRAVKVAGTAQTSCRKVHRVTLKDEIILP